MCHLLNNSKVHGSHWYEAILDLQLITLYAHVLRCHYSTIHIPDRPRVERAIAQTREVLQDWV